MFLLVSCISLLLHSNKKWSKIFHGFCVAETEKGIFDAILQGEIDFESQPWPTISTSAKDLVSKMLTQDPKRRISSAQVLGMLLPIQFFYFVSACM